MVMYVRVVINKEDWIRVEAKSFEEAEDKAEKIEGVVRVMEVSTIAGGVLT